MRKGHNCEPSTSCRTRDNGNQRFDEHFRHALRLPAVAVILHEKLERKCVNEAITA